MMKNVLIGIGFVAAITSLVLSLTNNSNKIVYVEMGKIYEDFALTKELNTELARVTNNRKHVTDSLLEDLKKQAQDLKFQSKKTMSDVERLQRVEEAYLYKKNALEKDNQTISTEYNEKIWNQINQYVADFGKEKKLTLILGANGQGNIMYGEDAKNITADVITYINSRYNGSDKK